MNFTPSPLQTLFLWRLLASDGGDFWKRIKPPIEAKERKALEEAGLITVEKRKESERKGARPVLVVSLTEQGWDWASNHLDADFSQKSPAAGPVLHSILGKLKVHLARTGTSLADFVCPPAMVRADGQTDMARNGFETGTIKPAADDGTCECGWQTSEAQLADVARDELDTVLLAMEREGGLVLYPLDDPQEIRPDDEAAAVPNTLGIRRHIVYIER